MGVVTGKAGGWTSLRFKWVIAAVMLVVLAAIAGLNIIIDPLDLYGNSFFQPWQFNRYERKLALFENYDSPQVLILGSSRVEALNPETVTELTGKNCFNWAQPSASAETILAALKLAVVENDAPIDTVIVCIDPMIYHPSLWIHPQARLVPDYTHYFSNDYAVTNLRERMARLFTLEQTSSSWKVIRRDLGLGSNVPRIEYREDGFAIYPQREESLLNGDYNLDQVLGERVPAYIDSVLGIEQFTGLSTVRQGYWEEFLQLSNEHGITVYAFIPPMHPDLWVFLEAQCVDHLYMETSAYVEQTVSDSGGVFRNYIDLDSFDGDPEMFWDEVHMRPENGEALLRDLLSAGY